MAPLYDNTRAHSVIDTNFLIIRFVWTVVNNPLEFQSSCKRFPTVSTAKTKLGGKLFDNDEELKTIVLEFFKSLNADF